MRFRSFDSLKLFCIVAEKMSFTAAGDKLHMSKGAVSYQIAKLEGELGFPLAARLPARARSRFAVGERDLLRGCIGTTDLAGCDAREEQENCVGSNGVANPRSSWAAGN